MLSCTVLVSVWHSVCARCMHVCGANKLAIGKAKFGEGGAPEPQQTPSSVINVKGC